MAAIARYAPTRVALPGVVSHILAVHVSRGDRGRLRARERGHVAIPR